MILPGGFGVEGIIAADKQDKKRRPHFFLRSTPIIRFRSKARNGTQPRRERDVMNRT